MAYVNYLGAHFPFPVPIVDAAPLFNDGVTTRPGCSLQTAMDFYWRTRTLIVIVYISMNFQGENDHVSEENSFVYTAGGSLYGLISSTAPDEKHLILPSNIIGLVSSSQHNNVSFYGEHNGDYMVPSADATCSLSASLFEPDANGHKMVYCASTGLYYPNVELIASIVSQGSGYSTGSVTLSTNGGTLGGSDDGGVTTTASVQVPISTIDGGLVFYIPVTFTRTALPRPSYDNQVETRYCNIAIESHPDASVPSFWTYNGKYSPDTGV